MYKWQRTLSQWLICIIGAWMLAACGSGDKGDSVLPRESDYKLTITGPGTLKPGASATITATLTDPSNQPAVGKSLTFTSSSNLTVAGSATTNASGQATTNISAGSTASGTGTVTASYTDSDGRLATKTLSLSIIDGYTIILTSDKSEVKTGGSEVATFTAFVTDANGSAISNTNVTFTVSDTTAGTFTGGSTATDNEGKASRTFKPSTINRDNRSIIVTAEVTNPANGSVASSGLTLDLTGTHLELSVPSPSITLGEQVLVTAILKDGSDNPIANQPITFASNGNTAVPVSTNTNASGQATSTVTVNSAPGGAATISASGYGSTGSVTLDVSGVDFKITSPTEGQDLAINATATPPGASDHPVQVEWKQNATPVVGKTVTFSTSQGQLSSPTAVTDASGKAIVYIKSSSAGLANIQARTLPADGNLSSQRSALFVASTPDAISVQALRTVVPVNEETTITATVKEGINPVKGKIVEFNVCQGAVSGTLVTPTATTNANGEAKVTFRASNTTSAANGVTIKASVQGTAVSTGTCSGVKLTVSGKALRLDIGTGRSIVSSGPTTYALPHTVSVADANGSPAKNAQVTLSILSLEYRKGEYVVGTNNTWVALPTAACANEDLYYSEGDNRRGNGYLDTGEDLNSNGLLDPGTPAILSTATVTTDNDGFASFDVNYSKSFGSWVKVRIKASTTVAGTESYSTRDFVLPISADDAKVNDGPPPGGMDSPYGTGALCTDTL